MHELEKKTEQTEPPERKKGRKETRSKGKTKNEINCTQEDENRTRRQKGGPRKTKNYKKRSC